jgi:hypothetical protein
VRTGRGRRRAAVDEVEGRSSWEQKRESEIGWGVREWDQEGREGKREKMEDRQRWTVGTQRARARARERAHERAHERERGGGGGEREREIGRTHLALPKYVMHTRALQ